MKIIFNEEQIKNLMIAYCSAYRNPIPYNESSVTWKTTATLEITTSDSDGQSIVGEVTIE